MKAFTTSSWPSMAAENNDGRAPLAMRYSAIGRFPVWEAAPSESSQSPKPQSQAARASDGRASTISFTRFKSKCETRTISRTNSDGCAGKVSFGLVATSSADSFLCEIKMGKGRMVEAYFNSERREMVPNITVLGGD